MQSQEEVRRAIGQNMVARRTGQNVVADINSLVQQPAQRKPLRTIESRGGIPATRGRGNYSAPLSNGNGGIASPLVETTYADRTYWPEQTLVSTDGLLSFRIRAVKSIKQTDANFAEVEQQFAQPSVPTGP